MSSRETCKSPDLASSFKMSTLAEVRREIGGGSSGGKSPHSDHHHHHQQQGLLSRDSSSYLANYNRTTTSSLSDHKHKSNSTSATATEQLRPSGAAYSSEDYSPAGTRSIHHPNHHPHHSTHPHHHRQQYKLVLEERQPSPDLHSNCSSTSPPAPAQVVPPAPAPAPPLTSKNSSQPRPSSMLYSGSSINNNNNISCGTAHSPATSKVSPVFHENDPFLLLHSSSKNDGGEDHSERLLPRRTAANNNSSSRKNSGALSPSLLSSTNGWQEQREQNSCNNNHQHTSNFNAGFFSKRHDILLSALDFLSPTTPPNATSAVLPLPLPGASTTTPTTTNPSANHHQSKAIPHHHHSSPHSQSLSPMPIGAEPLAQLLITLKEQNKSLIREIEDLRIKLADAEGDLKLVRCQMRSMSKNMDSLVLESSRDRLVDETILGDLEYYKEKVKMMERDIQSLLEEKDELAEERDELTLKNDRLNERLMTAIRNSSGNADGGNGASSFDHSGSSEALYLENRYLKEKIKSEEEERRLLLERLAKYKELMEEHQMGRSNDDNKKKYGNSADDSIDGLATTTMGGTNIQLPGGRIMSAREVEELIAPESIHSMSVSKTNQMYLWNLLVACYEGLQKKDLNLVRAKKTNRLLERRVEELMFGASNHSYDLHDYPDSYDHHQSRPSTGGKKISGNQRPSSSKSPLKRRGVEPTGGTAAAMIGESISASTTARSTPSSMFLRENNDALMTPDADLMTGGDCTDTVTIASSVSVTTTVKETSEDEDGLEANDVDNTELSTTPSTSIDTRLHLLEKDLKALDYMHYTPRLPVHHQSTVSPNHHSHHHHQSPLHQLHHHHQPFYDPPSSTYSTSNRDHSFGAEHHLSVISSHKSPTRGGLYN